ncbi:MAG: hypothetical protein ABIO70_21430 [Pseudomonadota bacterium]
MTFDDLLAQRFPGALLARDFVSENRQTLAALGFWPDNALAGIGLCRDEICTPFEDMLQATWGPSFVFASLAGAVLPGRTAFEAFLHHSPHVDGRHRVVCFGFAHVALSREGAQGWCRRPGRADPSNACGALKGVFNALQSTGALPHPDAAADMEFALLCERLAARLGGRIPADLIDLTQVAYEALAADWRALIDRCVDLHTTDVALITGTQIHGPQGLELVWIGDAGAWTNGRRVELQ